MFPSSSRDVMVVLSDGKPVTVIKGNKKKPEISPVHRKDAGGGAEGGVMGGVMVHDNNNMSFVGESSRMAAAAGSAGRSLGGIGGREQNASRLMFRHDLNENTTKLKEQEEQIELRRLRSENQLLKQRVENLEKETISMSERIVEDQVHHKKEIERQKSDMTLQISKTATQETFQQTDDSLFHPPENASSPCTCSCHEKFGSVKSSGVKDYESFLYTNNRPDTVISELSQRKIDASATIQQLTNKIKELENIKNEQRQSPVDSTNDLQRIQDELVACKLREAEANLAFKELQQKVYQLDKHWQQFIQENQNINQASDVRVKNQLDLKEMIMAMKIKETYLVSDISELKQKLMELETENHVYKRQEKRQGVEMEKLHEKISAAELSENEFSNTVKDLERRLSDIQSEQKDEIMMFKIREAEYCQATAEMRRRIAELEIENQELLTSAELHNKDQDIKEYENRIQELLEENQHLKSMNEPDVEFNNLDIIANCDFSDVMTESFYADTMCLHTSVLLADALQSEPGPDLIVNNLNQ